MYSFFGFVNNIIENLKGMIVLKYTENSSDKNKFGVGFYIVVAVCLIAVGGAAYFALSQKNNNTTEPEISSNQNSSYNDDITSYNDNTENQNEILGSEITAEPVSDVPYSSETQTEEKNLFVMPVNGEVIKGSDESQLQYSSTFSDLRIHKGVDISCELGTSVSACLDGTVLDVVEDASLGKGVVIDHGNGITVKYFALDSLTVVKGSTVKAGDIIGMSASIPSECVDKPHIHIEVYKDSALIDFSSISNN